MKSIAVLVSGGGSNLGALIDAVEQGEINGRIVSVVSSKDGVYALERAKKHNIPHCVISKKDNPSFDEEMYRHLKDNNVDIIVTAGYLSILADKVLTEWSGRIINVHPSLIPSFCGMGYYGLRVHEEVLKYGVKITGATVHYVTIVVDGGEIILQKAVDVYPTDTPEVLQKRVMEQAEWEILPKAVAMLCST